VVANVEVEAADVVAVLSLLEVAARVDVVAAAVALPLALRRAMVTLGYLVVVVVQPETSSDDGDDDNNEEI
jgi:sugar (pentulose or hexulose) kinase